MTIISLLNHNTIRGDWQGRFPDQGWRLTAVTLGGDWQDCSSPDHGRGLGVAILGGDWQDFFPDRGRGLSAATLGGDWLDRSSPDQGRGFSPATLGGDEQYCSPDQGRGFSPATLGGDEQYCSPDQGRGVSAATLGGDWQRLFHSWLGKRLCESRNTWQDWQECSRFWWMNRL